MATNIASYLPSKTFTTRVGFIVGAAVVIFGMMKLSNYFVNQRVVKGEEVTQPTAAPLVVKDIAQIDYNNDGVEDWKQNLTAALGITASPESSSIEEPPINETEQFARDLFTTAATISQSGDLTEEGSNAIATQVTDQIASQSLASVFTTADIKTVADTDQNRKTYSTNLKALFNTKYPLDIDVSVVILGDALDANDPTALAKLDPIILRYSQLIAALKALPPPKAAALGHVELMNRLNKTLGSIQLMKNTFNNPVSSLSASMQYSQTISDLLEYMVHLTNKLPYGNVATPIDADAAISELGQY